MSFFDDLALLNEDPEGPVVLTCLPDPNHPGWTLCRQWIPQVNRANAAAGPNTPRKECDRCWEENLTSFSSAAEAAHELTGFLANVSTLDFPSPAASPKITLRTILPGRWVVTDEDSTCTMIFSPDGTEWASRDEVHLETSEAARALSLPLDQAITLAERLLAVEGPIYPIGDPLRRPRST